MQCLDTGMVLFLFADDTIHTGTCSRPFVINYFNPTINVRY